MLPCLFIGTLALKWLAVEREAAAYRGADAARADLAALQHDLIDTLTGIAVRTAAALDAGGRQLPPFAPRPELDPLLADAFLFEDRHPAGLSASDKAAFEELRRNAAEVAGGRLAAAGGVAVRLMTCCPVARDEFGVPLSLYAARQRLVIAGLTQRTQVDRVSLVRDLAALIEQGYLGSGEDITAIGLIVEDLSGTPGADRLTVAVRQRHDESERRRVAHANAEAWISSVAGVTPVGPVTVAAWRQARPTIGVLWRGDRNQRLVMAVDPDGLAHLVGEWGAAHSRFDFTLSSTLRAADREPAPPAALLFAAAPSLVVAARARIQDPGTDRRRESLFMVAVGTVLVLTVVAGYLSVRDRSRELRTAAMRSTFVAGVTHELKTPIASIRLLAETLRSGRARPETAPELLDTIVGESEHLSRLVDNVLSSSRVESGTRLYTPRPCNLNDLVPAALRRFEYVSRREAFDVVTRFADAPVMCSVDADAFSQSILNLLDNAVKYSSTATRREITVTVAAEDGSGVVSVTDHGTGIEPEHLSSIFETFYRAPAASAGTAGAGLGLALVRHFANAQAGSVSASSLPGEGSTFTLRLPLCAGDVSEAVDDVTQPIRAAAVPHSPGVEPPRSR
jgi:signal transduction histidine kinase